MIDNGPPMDATGGAAIRKPGRSLLFLILMEEEVITLPRGGGGRPAPEPQGAPREVQAVPKSFPDDFLVDSFYGMAVCVKRILDRRCREYRMT